MGWGKTLLVWWSTVSFVSGALCRLGFRPVLRYWRRGLRLVSVCRVRMWHEHTDRSHQPLVFERRSELVSARSEAELARIDSADRRRVRQHIFKFPHCRPMVMGTSVCVRFQTNPSDPRAVATVPGKIESCRAPRAGRILH
ncbi:MAG: hypothetical protein JWR21_55, partial [Herminiimonas sp.]|nr:hypothetical protein [Herminiimonas sp.]